MRGAWLIGALLMLPLAAAAEPYLIVLDWQHGESLVGTTPLVASPLAPAFAFDVAECYPHLVVDLLYEPDELALAAEGIGEVGLGYDFLLQVWREGEMVTEARIRHSGYGTPIGGAADLGEHEVRVSLATGADVTWDFRLRARLATEDPDCAEPI